MKKIITSMLMVTGLMPVAAFARTGTVLPATPFSRSLPQASPTSQQVRALSAPAELQFIENKGQVTDQHRRPRQDIRFHVAGKGVQVFVGNGTLHYQFSKASGSRGATPGAVPEQQDIRYTGYRMDVVLAGANPHARVRTEEPQAYYETWFTGTGEDAGIVAHAFKKVIYEDIYPHIDWVLYSKGDKLEYDFVVKPGGKVSDIRIKYNGATGLKVNRDGSLTATTPMGTVTEQRPFSYTEGNGRQVAAAFELKQGVLGFRTGAYQGTLVIDPVLSWATYYGGESTDYIGTQNDPTSDAIAVDGNCNMFVTGMTESQTGIATSGSFHDTWGGRSYTFLAKFNPDGTRAWATYYPAFPSYPQVTTDNNNNIFISIPCLSAWDTLAATPGAHQSIRAGDYDALLVKFNPQGGREWATFFGGLARDMAFSVRCDNSNNVYIAGYTGAPFGGAEAGSTGLATQGAFRTDTIGGNDGLLAKFSPDGTLLWATYFGGTSYDKISSVACDAAGNVYIGGTTESAGISTIGGSLRGPGDAFLAKFSSSGSMLWTRYFGGDDYEEARSVHCDDYGNIYLAGTTSSSNGIATTGAYQQARGLAFLAKFDGQGNVKWGTYFLGNNFGSLTSVTTDPLGRIWLTGYYAPLSSEVRRIATPGSHKDSTNDADGFLSQLDSAGTTLLYGTFYGGIGQEYLLSVATDRQGGVYAAGYAVDVSGLATPGSHQDMLGGGMLDGFITKFTDCSVFGGTTITAAGNTTFCQGDSVVLTTGTPAGLGCLGYRWQLDGTNISGATGMSYAARVSGDYRIIITNDDGSCTDTSTTATTVTVHPLPEPPIVVNGFVLSTDSFVAYQWYRNNTLISGATSRQHTATQDGNYKVTVTDANGCSGTSDGRDITGTNGIRFVFKDQIRIYPNPTDNMLYVDAPVAVTLTITSVDGKVVQQHRQVRAADISGLAEGLYMIRVTDSDHTLLLTEKLIKSMAK